MDDTRLSYLADFLKITSGGFAHGGWTRPYWHDDIGRAFGSLMKDTDAFLLGRRTYVTHAQAFEPMPAGDFLGDMMNAPAKYVVSKTLEKPIWRNTTIIRDDVINAVRKLKAQPGKNHLSQGGAAEVRPARGDALPERRGRPALPAPADLS